MDTRRIGSAGARLIGTYDNQVAFGQSRVLLVWTRLVMPSGRSIVLERQPGADAAGYSGLQDEVDNHRKELLGAASLSTLLAGGTPLVQAMETAGGAIGSRLVSGAVIQSATLVREGQSLHNSLASTGLVPDLALEMVEVGEASGSLAAMLGSVAEFYEDDVNTHLTNLVALIEPAILIFMAILIAFILVALYLPMFSLSVGGQG